MAFNPYSPNASVEPRQAFPVMRPRCCFLYLTFLGINMTCYSSFFSAGGSLLTSGVGAISAAGGALSCLISCFQVGCGGANGGTIGADFPDARSGAVCTTGAVGSI